MQRLKRAFRELMTPDPDEVAEAAAEQLEQAGIDLTIEQRLTRVEVEIGDLWEHLKRWSARQAARARRDIEAAEAEAAPPPVNGTAARGPVASAAPVGLVPGSKQWREYQKSLIRQGVEAS